MNSKMIPRNKFDNAVVVANDKLSPIKTVGINWAIKNLIEHPAFRTKDNATVCGDCGYKFKHKGETVLIRCPHCGKSLSVLDTPKRVIENSVFWGQLDTVDGIQVERVSLLQLVFRKGQAFEVQNTEVLRMWLNVSGRMAVTARTRPNTSYYVDRFNLESAIELRKLTEIHLRISDVLIYPRYSVIPELQRNGFKGKLPNCHPFLFMRNLLIDSRYETLMKKGEIKAIEHFINSDHNLDTCWDSLKIAMRHKYKIEDFSLWYNTISLLSKLGKDIRSIKYICPDDLDAAHKRWKNKYDIMQDKEKAIAKLKQAKEKEAVFYSLKSCYFDISFSDGDIVVSVLNSIEAYMKEGAAMHHCVFDAKYYCRKDSLVLSAHDKDGERIETVEFSLTENKVLQSRGVRNSETKYHERIINLVNSNAYRFIEARPSA